MPTLIMHTHQDNENSATPATRLETAIAAADRLDGDLKAFNFRPDSYPDGAVVQTALSGVPVAVKDLVDTADMPTTYGSAIYAGHRPARDAWIVQRLRDAGAVIFGKTVTTEFAWRDPGATVNPWNPAYSPGGSSSGSAAAVGAGIVDVAIGTQTVGSIIRPASYCGVVGYKPTYGAIPHDGTRYLSPTLDHLGFITSDVHWAAVAHDLVCAHGKDAAQAGDAARKPARLGLYRSALWSQVDGDVKDNFDAVVRRLEACGVQCVEVGLGLDIREIVDAGNRIMAYETTQHLYRDIKDRLELAGPWTQDLIKLGLTISSDEYDSLRALVANMRMERDRPLDGIDAILSITSPTAAPFGLARTGDASFCAPWTFLGLPALGVPSGISDTLLPLGVQLVGRGGDDAQLIRIGRWLEGMLPRLAPPLHVGA